MWVPSVHRSDTLPTQVDLPPGNGRDSPVRSGPRNGALAGGELSNWARVPVVWPSTRRAPLHGQRNRSRRCRGTRQRRAFAIEPATGQLELLNTVSAGGAGPTYVSLHPSGQHLLVANYFGGSVAVLPVLGDGRLGEATSVVQHQGQIGPTVATHAPPGSFAFSGHDRTHAHMIQSDPSGRFVLHVDLGLDTIFVSRFDAARGRLLANDPPGVALPPGDGPRHFHFHPGGRWLYSVQEEGQPSCCSTMTLGKGG